ncbi:hypothetical protein CSA37_03240 [Candidatus Fermentibacteria bacterium]|nr:MAG: hypothetical protein CSA37_03240 [Candidatus Fermentibacteria bacterium]
MVQRKKLNRLILPVAFAVRVFIFFLAAGGFFLVGEGMVQANIAGNILSGRGCMLSESMMHDTDPRRDASLEFFREAGGFYGTLIPERPTSFFVPGYILFEAFIFSLFSPGNLTAVIGVQLLLGILTVFMGLRLASRFLTGWWYTACGFLMAVDPFELYYQAIPVTQALFSFLFIAGLLMSVRLIEKPGWSRAILAGIVWSASFMVRPASLPMILWLAVVLILFTGRPEVRKILYSSLMVIVFFGLLTPWMLRNRNVMGRYQLLPLQGGVQMWEYNGRIFTDAFLNDQQGAKVLYGPVRETWLNRLAKPELAEFPQFTCETEFQRDSILYERQSEFLMANPLLYLHLSCCRFAEFFKPFPLNSFSLLHTIPGFMSFFWVGIFFLAGIFLFLYRKGQGIFLSGVMAGYILMHLITASGTPHRVALDIPLFIAAMTGLRHFCLRAGLLRRK